MEMYWILDVNNMMAWYDIMTKSFLRKKERSIIALKIKKMTSDKLIMFIQLKLTL